MITQKEFEMIEFDLVTKYCYTPEEIKDIMEKLREIDRLRDEKNAVILAHYYQIPPIQMIADFKGDSLQLAEYARNIKDKKLIVSSTVYFMAEMIKILSPEKKVIIPDKTAGCSIASGMNIDTVKILRTAFPNAKIVAYINTNADVKSGVDCICTSANASSIIKNLESEEILMIPDYYFSYNIIKGLGEDIKKKRYLAYKGIIAEKIVVDDISNNKSYYIEQKGEKPELDKGICIVHEQFTREEIENIKEKESVDEVLAHPEVNPDIIPVIDMVGGTGKMIEHAGKSKSKRFLIITECDLMTPLLEKYPDKEFITPCKLCPYMKRNTLQKLLDALKNESEEIFIDDDVMDKSRDTLNKMFEIKENNSGG